MAFEQYMRTKYPHPGRKAYVSISKHGNIGFSKKCEHTLLHGYDHILLFYDEDKQKVGFRPEKKAVDDAYPLRHKDRSMTMISGTGFLKFFKIDFSETRRYEPSWNEEEGLIEIDLNKPIGRN